jgi:hypothetical protein
MLPVAPESFSVVMAEVEEDLGHAGSALDPATKTSPAGSSVTASAPSSAE